MELVNGVLELNFIDLDNFEKSCEGGLSTSGALESMLYVDWIEIQNIKTIKFVGRTNERYNKIYEIVVKELENLIVQQKNR